MNAFFETLRRLGPAKLVALAVVAAGLLAFFSFFTNRLTQPPMALLYGELSGSDAGQIVAKLEQQNVPFEIRAGGGQVWVPVDRALRLRMGMAEQGLPRGGSVGYEIFDRSDALGATGFVQSLNHVRALEGELARTIGALGPVAAARVHLVIPRRDLFARERQEPTASVALKLRDAGRLPRPQVQAIQHLIAAAVPGLKPARVSVIDDRGNLLARGAGDGDDAGAGATAAAADDMRRAAEQTLARKIEEQLERATGPGKVRAEVALDMDFDRVVTNSESFDPDGQVVRSQQTVSENGDATEAAAGGGVTVGNNLPDGESGPGGQNRNKTTRQEETINYEITRTTRNHVREGGIVRRLSASIVVDGFTATGSDGKRTYQPRNPEEMEQLKALARSAVGFNAQRGDTLELVNLQFAGGETPESLPEPGMFDVSRQEIFRAAELGVLLVVALLVILLVARPLIGMLARAVPAAAGSPAPLAVEGGGAAPAQLAAPAGAQARLAPPAADDPMIDLSRVEGRVKASAIKKVGEIVEKHPEEAVAIIRQWMYQEA